MSSTSSSASSSGGIGFAGVLTIVFIILKLLHKIGWAWWLVLAPMWIGAALVVVVLVGALAVALVAGR